MDEQLVFLLIPDERWESYVVHPARVTDYGEFYSYLGQYRLADAIDPGERRILELCRLLEAGSVYKRFGSGRFRTERDFLTQADEELVRTVREFSDRIITEIIRLIALGCFPLYLRRDYLENPHKKDRITIHREPLQVSVGFFRNEENIRYRLTLSDRGREIIPSESKMEIITREPGLVLLGNDLFSLPAGFSGLRLKPFRTKKEVIIPRQNEKEYFQKFILKNIHHGEIEAEGFEIVEKEAVKTAILSLEKDITGELITALLFRYNHNAVAYSSPVRFVVELEETDDNYRFYKTPRDHQWEKSCRDRLIQSGLTEWQPDYYKVSAMDDPLAFIDWFKQHRERLQAAGFELSQQDLSHPYYLGEWELRQSRQSVQEGVWVDSRIVLEDGYNFPLQALKENILSANREYLFRKHTLFVIPQEWFALYSPLLLFGEKKADRLVIHRNQFSLLETKNTIVPSVLPEETEIPHKLRATLREYQVTGFHWLYHLYQQQMGACLADDMGLGKTIQTIALLLKYKEEHPRRPEPEIPKQPDRLPADLFSGIPDETGEENAEVQDRFATCLIVAPASVVHNWRNEFRRFAPSLTVTEYIGPARSHMRQALMRWDVVITTYQTLRNDIDLLKGRRFGIVVFDESQSFKNRDSQVYKAVSLIKGRHFVALSGTPIENSLSDLWSLMSVINKGLLGNHTTFYNYFIRPIHADINGLHSDSLRKLIRPFILRRTKEEVLSDLPERTDELVMCDADPEQRQLYKEELSRARYQIKEKHLLQVQGKNEVLGSLQAIMRLRQIANHPRLADPAYDHSSGKFREIFRMLDELVNTRHKVLLFSDYVSYLYLIAEEMQHRHWDYAMLTGSTTRREEVIRHFSSRPECRFFLISLKAGGVGLNLTEADYVFILDPWWNLAAEEQAISRAHRIGQKHAVFVYRFITAGTLEEKILNIQRRKQDISDAIILSAENTFQPSEKEIEKLLLE